MAGRGSKGSNKPTEKPATEGARRGVDRAALAAARNAYANAVAKQPNGPDGFPCCVGLDIEDLRASLGNEHEDLRKLLEGGSPFAFIHAAVVQAAATAWGESAQFTSVHDGLGVFFDELDDALSETKPISRAMVRLLLLLPHPGARHAHRGLVKVHARSHEDLVARGRDDDHITWTDEEHATLLPATTDVSVDILRAFLLTWSQDHCGERTAAAKELGAATWSDLLTAKTPPVLHGALEDLEDRLADAVHGLRVPFTPIRLSRVLAFGSRVLFRGAGRR